MEVSYSYPGSIGEIIQGRFGSTDVLLSCPINLYTTVRLFKISYPHLRNNYPKTHIFLKNILQKWGYSSYFTLLDFEISSCIPVSKGFASSTADLCAMYGCLCNFFNRKWDEDELASECIRIEPTDSIVFRSMTLFDYKGGTIRRKLGEYMKFYILAFVGNKTVDTVAFNNSSLNEQSLIDDLVAKVTQGVGRHQLKSILEASTESVMRNQHRIKYDILDDIIKLKEATGGLGIIGAHSGDILAVAYESEKQVDQVMQNIKVIDNYKIYKLETVIFK
jgi:L-threonine kinase